MIRGEEPEKKRNAFSRIRRACGQVGVNHAYLCNINGCCDWQDTGTSAGSVGKERNTYFSSAATILIYLEPC